MTGVEFARILRVEEGFGGPLLLYSSAGGLIPYAEVDALDINLIEKTSVVELLEAVREAASRSIER